MAEANLKQISTASTKTSAPASVRRCSDHANRRRVVQSYMLVWLDANVTVSSEDSQHTLKQFRSLVNDVNLFLEPDDCVDFLTDIELEQVFLIVSNSLGRDLVPCIHPMTQIDAIYIFCDDQTQYEEWVQEWSKVKGVYTQIEPICQALELATKKCDQDFVAVSFPEFHTEGASDINLNQLEPSFMYTQLFKKTLLDMDHDQEKEVRDLVKYCEERYADNPTQLDLIHQFGLNYHPNQAIWWYTCQVFIYQMLNRALRLLEADIIVNMGFFIYDLHQQIQQLHTEQVVTYGAEPFFVYRGQGLSTADFEKLKKSQGGLMSFNCFLSTSRKKELSMAFAESAAMVENGIGILFGMSIDPNIASSPFADVQTVSFFQEEAEILFSMHAVFRIQAIKPLDVGRRQFEVDLTLTTDDDTQLRTLMKQLDGDVQTSNGLDRMGQLLIKVGQTDKAEELYRTLLEQSSTQTDRSRYYHQLGYVKDARSDYEEALRYYTQANEIRQENRLASESDLAIFYNNTGMMYKNLGDYSNALIALKMAVGIWKTCLPAQPPNVAVAYNNIGMVYRNMGEYSKALFCYEQALEIRQECLPANHPELAASYNNIGSLYYEIYEYSKALSSFERALEIWKESLPANHPDLAISYNNIGSVYIKMDEYSKALSILEQALEIRQECLPANHPELAASYNNIGSLYYEIYEYSKALSSFERALEIWKESLPANHPDLAISYNNIGSVYIKMDEYSKALSILEQALEIRQKSLRANHPDFATSYSNIGWVKYYMGDYSKALSSFERALDIQQKSLPPNHPDFADSYSNVGWVYRNMGEYSKALSYYEQALEIQQKSLPASHPYLLSVREDVESLKLELNAK